VFLATKLYLFREGDHIAPLEAQFALARRHGAVARDFMGDGSHRTFIVRKARRGQPPDYWFDELVKHRRDGAIVHVESAMILGDSAAEQHRRALAVAGIGAVLFDMGANDGAGILVGDFAGTMTFLERGRALVGQVVHRRLERGKRRSGNKGGKKPEFSDAEIKRVQDLWAIAASQDHLLDLIEEDLGRRPSYSTPFRWAKANKWGERGAGLIKRGPSPRQRSKRRHQ
jgi:hypothetical protein